jgi:Fe-Mn family superoxide dismutase
MALHGSGWVYLALDGTVKTIRNHAVREDIVILVDMWEHAYALDYEWKKEQYLDNIWRIMNWPHIEDRLGLM